MRRMLRPAHRHDGSNRAVTPLVRTGVSGPVPVLGCTAMQSGTMPSMTRDLPSKAPPRGVTPRMRTFLAIVAIAIVLFPIADFLNAAAKPNFNGYGAIDFDLYLNATRRWLAGGSFFEPYQLAGPYAIRMGDVLYPPNVLLLLIPFTVLPAILWWAIPLGVTAWAVWRLQPAPVSWPFIAFCLFWPPFVARAVAGNPIMWALAFLALGCLYKWPAALVLIKPSLFPFALVGIRNRSWWIALLIGIAVSLPFAGMWIDWVRVLVNSTEGGLLYSLQDVPILLLPIIAWKMR